MSKKQPQNTPSHVKVKQTHRQPSLYLNKHTAPQGEAHNALLVQGANQFFTKQRPESWQYYYRSFTLQNGSQGLDGLNTSPNGVSIFLEDVAQGQSLIINHFRLVIGYKLARDNSSPLPYGANVLTFFDDYQLIDANFSFNLTSSQSSLVDVKASFDNEFTPISYTPRGESYSGFRVLNQNVLANENSSTSLYVLEPSKLYFQYVYTPSFTTGGNDVPLYTKIPEPLLDKYVNFTMFVELRGHLLNRLDGQLLREVLRPDHVRPKGAK